MLRLEIEIDLSSADLLTTNVSALEHASSDMAKDLGYLLRRFQLSQNNDGHQIIIRSGCILYHALVSLEDNSVICNIWDKVLTQLLGCLTELRAAPWMSDMHRQVG